VLKVGKSASGIVFVHPKDERTKDDPMVRQPDISRARQLLGWEPVVSLEEGLTKTIDWFRDRLRR
jgi:dTDP-glucose 4,6-dehydratase